MQSTSLIVISSLIVAIGSDVYIPGHGPATGVRALSDSSLNQPIKQDVVNYLGVPFAKPPLGNLRFRPPQKYEETWSEPRLFVKSQKDCMQGARGSEDCLYLNIFVPASASESAPVPVMFWIYGGGFTFGRVSMYDGSALAAQEDVIVVVPSYRIGPLGFLASEATMRESGTTGNWGILDQQLALKWVSEKIYAFGGDPTRVTIFGESAGGISVATHLSSPESQGLFSSAIIQSGVLDLELFYLDRADSYRFYDWLASNITFCSNGNDMECLRRVPASRFAIPDSVRDSRDRAPTWAASLFPFFSFGLTIDDRVVLGSPLKMALEKRTAAVPVVIGLTQDEGTLFAMAAPKVVRPKPSMPPTESDVISMLEYFMGPSNRDLISDRFKAEFEFHRTQFPSVSTMEGLESFKSAKANQWKAFRTLNIDESKYVDVSDVLAKPGGSLEEIQKAMVSELIAKDIARISFSTFIRDSPTLALLYEASKGREGSPSLKPYDKAAFSFITAVTRDIIFACPLLAFAKAHRKAGNKVFIYNLALDVWNGTIMYNVDMQSLVGKDAGPLAVSDLGMFHGADIPLVFKLFRSKPVHPAEVNLFEIFNLFTGNQVSRPGDAAHKVADKIGCYWANLAKCGDVVCANSCHGESLPEWPSVDPMSTIYMNIGSRGDFELGLNQETGFAGVGAAFPSHEQCAAWKSAEFKYLDIRSHNMKLRQALV